MSLHRREASRIELSLKPKRLEELPSVLSSRTTSFSATLLDHPVSSSASDVVYLYPDTCPARGRINQSVQTHASSMFSFHSHSGSFCCHAVGSLDQVVATAVEKGFRAYGLSEHVPRYREADLYPEEVEHGLDRLSSQFEAYLVEAHRLKVLYANRIDLVVGLETEFINEEGLVHLEELLSSKVLSGAVEYVVGSVHHVDSQPIDFSVALFDSLLATYPSCPSHTSQFSALFCSYFDAQYTMLQRIKPEVVGHFDLCKLYYPDIDLSLDEKVWKKVVRNIDFVVGYGGLFEISSAAFRKGWKTAYPSREVFDAIQLRQGRFTLSDDAHGPAHVGQNYDRLFDYLEAQGLETLYYLSSLDGSVVMDDEVGRSRGVAVRKLYGKPWTNEWRSETEKIDVT